jgi:hypothetical protein
MGGDVQQSGARSARRVSDEAGDLLRLAVRRQMNHGGNVLLSGVEPLSDDEFFAESGSGSSPAWTVGHLACVTDLFTSWLADGRRFNDRRAHEVFNRLEIGKSEQSKATSVRRDEFSKGDILLMFRESQVRAIHLLEDFDVALWNERTPKSIPETLPTFGAIWESLGVHTFWHLGELSGSIARFHGTYTLNTVTHYFYAPRPAAEGA